MWARLLPNNEGTVDRGLRITAGLSLLSLLFFGPQTLWGLMGLVPLATGLLGSCPAYTLLGVSTRRARAAAVNEAAAQGAHEVSR